MLVPDIKGSHDLQKPVIGWHIGGADLALPGESYEMESKEYQSVKATEDDHKRNILLILEEGGHHEKDKD